MHTTVCQPRAVSLCFVSHTYTIHTNCRSSAGSRLYSTYEVRMQDTSSVDPYHTTAINHPYIHIMTAFTLTVTLITVDNPAKIRTVLTTLTVLTTVRALTALISNFRTPTLLLY